MSMIGLHIRKIRKNSGLTLESFANVLDVGITTVKNIETGYLPAPDMKFIEKVCEVFAVSVEELTNSVSPCVGDGSKIVHIAEYISCEKPFLQPELVVESMFVNSDEFRGYEYIGIKMKDMSMIDSHICPGDKVVIRMGDAVKNGDMVACVFKGTDSIIRRVYMNGNEVVLKANNANGLYPDIRLDKEKDEFRIIGKVTNWMHNEEENR